MRKKVRRSLALLLAAVMLLGNTMTPIAETSEGSDAGQEYTLTEGTDPKDDGETGTDEETKDTVAGGADSTEDTKTDDIPDNDEMTGDEDAPAVVVDEDKTS